MEMQTQEYMKSEESLMLKREVQAVCGKDCAPEEVKEIINKYGIVYVTENDRYLGCITNTDMKGGGYVINTNSKLIHAGKDEKWKARTIFKDYPAVKNIPVIDENGKLLYEIVRSELRAERFNSKEYWEQRYQDGGTSGSGSYNRLAVFKAEVINDFITENDVHSMIEWGCGDGNQLGMFQTIDYRGYDVSETAVEICNYKYKNDPYKKFFTYDGSILKIKNADLAVSLDVIFYLVEDENYKNYMENLFSSSDKYICIYSSDFEQDSGLHELKRNFTKYVKQKFPDWELFKYIRNKYPYDENDKDNTSLSDFYFYVKNNA